MQQMFPADTIHRVVLSAVNGDLNIHGWEEQSIQVETDDQSAETQVEGDTLMMGNIKDSLTVWVPVEIAVHVGSIGNDTTIENVREVTIGDIGNGASLSEIALVKIGYIGDDLTLDRVVEATTSNVDGDLDVQGGIGILHCGRIQGDCQVQGGGSAEITLEYVGGDSKVEGVSRLQMGNVGSDCHIQSSASAEVTIGNVGSDLTIIGAARVQAGNVGSDCKLRDIQGDVTIGAIGSDAKFTGIGGNVQVSNIGSDANLQGLHGSTQVGTIGADLQMQAAFPAGSVTRLHVGADARITLPENANLSIRATVGGDVRSHSITSGTAGNLVNLVYGDGSAQLELHAGGDLHLQGNASPRSSQSSGSSWGNFGHDMSEFAREMERLGRDFHHEISAAINEATSSSGSNFVGSDTSNAEQQAQHYAEGQQRRFEEKRRYSKRPGRRGDSIHMRIHDREWHMDQERVEQIVEQARSAATDGIKGALEAVEQALKNLHITLPPFPERPVPPAAPAAPRYPESPVSTAAAEPGTSGINPEQERKAILHMIAEGRISVEEGDLLLEALGG